ncbi:lysine-specific demethylase lid-like isoform X2 [Chrysoperla carnea]|uniref:lysine-specific demethylase lid-like isoform X2 n=1 Tax=Chrysoperla carnea TaxID=189513 RepID=UPI001D07FC61|nr:lysine-specific demethylase lid-like isoform X2 [Chrysoperla carnea]
MMDELTKETSATPPPTKSNKKSFGKLPEVPVFRPTFEEFADPMSYLNKIRRDVEKIGLCKIIPPSNWQPPFALDIEKLKFIPRIQRLNELEASTRIKLNFLNKLATFWEMQGSKLKVPIVEQNPLDLYELRKLVLNNGGYYIVTSTKKWDFIASELEYPAEKCGHVLKSHYNKIICPYDIFESRKESQKKDETKKDDSGYEENSSKFENKEIEIADQQEHRTLFESKPGKSCKELQRLQFHGAGPKMAGFIQPFQSRKRKSLSTEDPLFEYICKFCKKRDYDEVMLLCNQCEASYHLYCLKPPLLHIPEGEWCCIECTANAIDKNMEPFGFLQAEREYTLQQFGEKAEKFKFEYFKMPIRQISSEMIEQKYWDIMSSIDSEVTVEYGADLHTIDHGSAFPTKKSINLCGEDVDYANSPWNLNNIPIIEGSVLSYLTGDISGIKLPWMYVGMLFSTFCWHNEDHWTYSINYLHWGEAKTWYCVPGEYADKFEQTFMSVASELFEEQPDLLHQLVTQMNPHILIEAGVPVHRIDQYPGEFVITFPRAYHAGFNQGYNFAEAVNFAPAEWLKMGRECIQYYSYYRRFCVFSHDELVCKMAENADKLSLTIAAVTYEDLITMVKIEKEFRRQLLVWGVKKVERVSFEVLADENRQCSICNTTCFLSAITCKCNSKKLACFRHFKLLCDCPPEDHILKYRYTMDELPQLLQNVKCKAESFDRWVNRVRDILVYKKLSISFNDLKNLYLEAISKKFPFCKLLDILKNTIDVAEKCINYIEKIDTLSGQITVTELKSVSDEVTRLCSLQEVDILNKRISEAEKFQYNATVLLSKRLNENDLINELENCVNSSTSLSVDFNIITQLKVRLHSVQWCNEICKRINAGEKMSINNLQFYIKTGSNLEKNELTSKIVEDLKSFLSRSMDWEQRVKVCLKSKTSFQNLSQEMKLLLKDMQQIPVELPSQCVLQDTHKMVMDWFKLASNAIQFCTAFNYKKFNFLSLETIVKQGKKLPVKFTEMENFEKDYKEACDWKKRVLNLFAKDSTMSVNQLADLICPRCFVLPLLISGEPKTVTASNIVYSYNRAQLMEIEKMKKTEKENMKNISNSLQALKFCTCNRSKFGKMIQCDLCKNLYHITCVKNFTKPYYLCSNCKRTKRPTIASVEALLNDLQKIAVHLDEGDMLECFMRRVYQWKKQVEYFTEKFNDLRNSDYTTCSSFLSNTLREGELLEVSDVHDDILRIRELLKAFQPMQNLYNFDNEVIDLTIDDEDKDVNKMPVSIEYVGPHMKCRAKKCLKPRDEYVDWVQCEGRCLQWYHLLCLGLVSQDLKPDVEYICPQCICKRRLTF